MSAVPPPPSAGVRGRSDLPFFVCFGILGGTYVVLILALVIAQLFFTSPQHVLRALASEKIQFAVWLSLISCTLTTLLCLWVAVPLGYLMSRFSFFGKRFIDAVIDVPILLPPLVVGLGLLMLFQLPPGRFVDRWFPVTFAIPAVVLAQFTVSCAFAVRTMHVTFDQISPRTEDVALTLGCSRGQAFWMVVFPQAWRGLLTAATLAWARSLGEFGPILVFAGTTPFRTEVLPVSVFLELNNGELRSAVAVSLIMLLSAAVVLVITRLFGLRATGVG